MNGFDADGAFVTFAPRLLLTWDGRGYVKFPPPDRIFQRERSQARIRASAFSVTMPARASA
jgi:hypothetical protein